MKNRTVRLAGLLLALLPLMAGCEDPLQDEGSSRPSPRPPAVEGTGPERPAPAGKRKPTIEMPGLPIGPDPENASQERQQCVVVKWLGPPIPDSVSVEVTLVNIEPPGVFEQSPVDGCATDLCKSSRFTFTSGRTSCNVPVVAGPKGGFANLSLNGKVRCPAGEKKLCDYFVAQTRRSSKDKQDTIGLYAQPEEQAPAEPPPPADTSSED